MDAGDGSGAPVRVMIAGGGTGGHLVPSINIADALTRSGREVEVLLVGGERGPDRTLLPASGHPHRFLAAPVLDRVRPLRNLALPARLSRAIAAARSLVREFDPHVVVGTGGYVSVPVGIAARSGGRTLVLQEQNRHPGVATRLLSRWAERVFVAYPEMDGAIGGRASIELTGNPIAEQRATPAPFAACLDPSLPTIGIFGGSQGASALNDAAIDLIQADETAMNVVWQTGAADRDRVVDIGPWPAHVVVEPFFSPMSSVYPLLDLIVCRAGAMTLAEVTAWGVPAVLVPYPHATADHQTANARALERAGAAIVVPEGSGFGRRLANVVRGLLEDEPRRAGMAEAARGVARPEAARTIADRIVEVAEAGAA